MTHKYNQKILRAKQKFLERMEKKGKSAPNDNERIPPGQHIAKGFPILDLGIRPDFASDTWRFKVVGEIENTLEFSWDELLKLPKHQQTSDFHCVTTWSVLDVLWGGIKLKEILNLACLKDSAQFVILHSSDGYTTNVPLEDALAEDVMLAYELQNELLTIEHGGPIRFVLPALYGWKSAKFLHTIEFSSVDKPGFWEVRGYHNHGDPWLEERQTSSPLDYLRKRAEETLKQKDKQ
ncbi:sulfite oxidase-like oxidoreductase [Candidatus Uabimicrobium sp. HlEnr_7]|uniref:sulfite oxidase-like oxidoreductase n=1 Tax=Candidatus Uabimicrobium helgolandensis TaxID=3095367 RepID=UPI003556C294